MGKDTFAMTANASKKRIVESPGVHISSFGPIEESFEDDECCALTLENLAQRDPISNSQDIHLVSVDTLAGK